MREKSLRTRHGTPVQGTTDTTILAPATLHLCQANLRVLERPAADQALLGVSTTTIANCEDVWVGRVPGEGSDGPAVSEGTAVDPESVEMASGDGQTVHC